MAPAPGLSRTVILTFAIGITFGFTLTYVMFSTSNWKASRRPIKKLSQGHLPGDPHTHGELDEEDSLSPGGAQAWNDFHAENHKGELFL